MGGVPLNLRIFAMEGETCARHFQHTSKVVNSMV